MIDPERSSRSFEFWWTNAAWTDNGLEKWIDRTVGWVLRQDRDYMVVASPQVTCIPRGCIVKIKEVLEDAPENA